MPDIRFSATKLANTGKKGKLVPDENGYYTLILGGLNAFNQSGQYYTYEGAKQLFDSSSAFMRKVKNGCLKSELGHPKRLPGMTDDSYLNRILTVEETNVSAHISEVWLDFNYGKNHPEVNNPGMIAIMGKVIPSGARAAQLKASLENGLENVCFSIRSLTRDYMERGIHYKVIQQIIGFDQVTEPGIASANKWDSPGLESIVDLHVSKAILKNIAESRSVVSTESSKIAAVEALALFEDSSSTKKPLFTKW